MEDTTMKRIIKLQSSNGKIFEVNELVASQSQVIKNIIEDVGINQSITLVKVSSDILSKVIDYCKYHVESQTNNIDKIRSTSKDEIDKEIETWDVTFVKVDFAILIDLILVANYLHIESLEDLLCQTIANIITSNKHEEIRQIFNTQNYFINEKDGVIQRTNQLLYFLILQLSNELEHKIKIKVGQNFHLGMWSAWRYDGDTRTLIVGLGKLHLTLERDQQINDILLHVDIGLVNILVLQTGIKCSMAPHRSGRERLHWIEQLDLNLFKNLVDFIDMHKLEKLIIDDVSIDPELEND